MSCEDIHFKILESFSSESSCSLIWLLITSHCFSNDFHCRFESSHLELRGYAKDTYCPGIF